MNAPPTGWNHWGNEGDLLDSGSGTWFVNDDNFASQSANPAVGLLDYTYEFRARLLVPLAASQGGNPGRWWPIGVYMSDLNNSMNRSAAYFGVENANPDFVVLDKPLSDAPGPNLDNGNFAVFRVIKNASADTVSLYIDGALIHTASAGGAVLNGADDPLTFGSFEVGAGSGTEWDYIRVVRGIVPNGTSIDPVPEPSTLSLLGLAGLALIRRRR